MTGIKGCAILACTQIIGRPRASGPGHSHILPVYDYGQEGDYSYIVLKYVPAGTLQDRIDAGSLSLQTSVDIVGQVAKALDHAHQRGIIHRDVKPSNVLADVYSLGVVLFEMLTGQVPNDDPGFSIQAGEWEANADDDAYGGEFLYAPPGCTSCRARFDVTGYANADAVALTPAGSWTPQ